MTAQSSRQRADELNAHCRGQNLDPRRLGDAFVQRGIAPSQLETLLAARPHLFSGTAVFVSQDQLDALRATIRAIEETIARPGWPQLALAQAPAIANHPSAARGAFMGYDFHLGSGEPRLIEINTNAGGAYLAALLTHAQLAGCAEALAQPNTALDLDMLEQRWLAMFREEWRCTRGEAPLRHIAIVDEAPQAQFLYPEFLLFQNLFERHGIRASIAAPTEFVWRNGLLLSAGDPVDLVYNRLTDFTLASPACAALRAAHLADAIVLTPNPRLHALFADKRHLVRLSDPALLTRLGLPEALRDRLARSVPHAKVVHPDEADRLWAERKGFFFKPAAGFGSRAAYRGDKLTRRVWGEILAGDYVAQSLVPTSLRRTGHGEEARDLKFDLRAYAYAGEIQLLVARLYEGQTTNFRTPGGGFAPVFVTPAPPA